MLPRIGLARVGPARIGLARARLARAGLATLLVLHALAHANAGMWAADTAHAPLLAALGASADTRLWIATALWALATVGFMAGGFAVAGLGAPRPRWQELAAVGATASLLLAALYSPVTIGPGVLVDALVLAAAVVTLRRDRGREDATPSLRPPPRHPWRRRAAATLAALTLAHVGVTIAARPWTLRWGTTSAERAAPLPGDSLVPAPHYRIDHAVTVRAPAGAVWPWLAQLGQDRGGFYSYDWLERLFGDDVHNADAIVPAWQHRAPGDLVRAAQPDYLGGRLGRELGWRVRLVEPGRALYLENWGAFVVVPVDARTSRLVVRTRGAGEPNVVLAPLGAFVFEPAHFIMERGMLLGVKRRAEGLTS
jgi:hypothetical protein